MQSTIDQASDGDEIAHDVGRRLERRSVVAVRSDIPVSARYALRVARIEDLRDGIEELLDGVVGDNEPRRVSSAAMAWRRQGKGKTHCLPSVASFCSASFKSCFFSSTPLEPGDGARCRIVDILVVVWGGWRIRSGAVVGGR